MTGSMPLTTRMDTGNDNHAACAVFTTPINSATIGHYPDSVPHKHPTLRKTAEPHGAVPRSAGSSNGLSPQKGIFGLLNHRVHGVYKSRTFAEFESAYSLALAHARQTSASTSDLKMRFINSACTGGLGAEWRPSMRCYRRPIWRLA